MFTYLLRLRLMRKYLLGIVAVTLLHGTKAARDIHPMTCFIFLSKSELASIQPAQQGTFYFNLSRRHFFEWKKKEGYQISTISRGVTQCIRFRQYPSSGILTLIPSISLVTRIWQPRRDLRKAAENFWSTQFIGGNKKVLSMGTLTFLLAQMPNLAYPLLHPSSGEEYHILLSQRPDDT